MAESILGKIVLWASLIIFILVVSYALYSPQGLISEIANLALGAERFLPFEPAKEVRQDDSLPEPAVKAQESFMGSISKNSEKEECLQVLSDLSGLGSLSMEVSNYEDKVISAIEKPIGKEGGIKLNARQSENKLQICVIEPKAFYDCYINTKRECTNEPFKPVNSVHLTKDSIAIEGATYKLENGFLFKPKKDKVCFMPVHGSTGDKWYKLWKVFTKWGCDAGKDTIDDDCIKEIRKRINLC